MGVLPKDSNGQKSPSDSSLMVVLASIADTTWRMFVPSVGGTLIGLWLDSRWQTTPWLMFAGVIIGFAIAVLAVKIQLNKLK